MWLMLLNTRIKVLNFILAKRKSQKWKLMKNHLKGVEKFIDEYEYNVCDFVDILGTCKWSAAYQNFLAYIYSIYKQYALFPTKYGFEFDATKT